MELPASPSLLAASRPGAGRHQIRGSHLCCEASVCRTGQKAWGAGCYPWSSARSWNDRCPAQDCEYHVQIENLWTGERTQTVLLCPMDPGFASHGSGMVTKTLFSTTESSLILWNLFSHRPRTSKQIFTAIMARNLCILRPNLDLMSDRNQIGVPLSPILSDKTPSSEVC